MSVLLHLDTLRYSLSSPIPALGSCEYFLIDNFSLHTIIISFPRDLPVTFHLVGDLGQTTNSNSTLEQLSELDLSLKTYSGGIINMGDLSYANGDEPLWDSFGVLKQHTAAKIPMFTTVGNHEWFDSDNYDFTAFLARFDTPSTDGQLYYSFDVGLAHWVMVAGYCQQMKTVTSQPCLAAGSPQMKVIACSIP